MVIHYGGNQMNSAIYTMTTSTFSAVLRNVNASTKADVQIIYWTSIGYQ